MTHLQALQELSKVSYFLVKHDGDLESQAYIRWENRLNLAMKAIKANKNS